MKIEIKIPQVGESITEVTVGQWLKNSGDGVKMDEVVCEIESEKATIEVTAPETGVLEVLTEEGETVAIGTVIAMVDTEGSVEASADTKAEPQKEAAKEAPEITTGQAQGETPQKRVSPVAAKILSAAGIADGEVAGSGVAGKVVKEDALNAIKQRPQPAETTQPAPPKAKTVAPEKAKAAIDFSAGRERTQREVRMSTLRKTIANRLVTAKNETAMLTTFNEVDMGPIMDARKKYKDLFLKKYDIKLGFMSFFVKACSQALLEFPDVNAKIVEDNIVYSDYADISIAVSTPQGLVVPVIFDADQMNLAQIELEVARLAGKARDKKLTIEEMSGGTFSITNGGVFGSLLSTPLVNYPQAAILGMHKIQERPMAINGEVVIRPMMYISLSYDHRIIDGKESVGFVVRVKELLEDPLRMLLEI